MTREILFRGKRADDGEWIESGSIKQISSDEIFLLTGRCWVKVVPSCVGQFTGLTDKNGVKIFEGDIVDVTYSDELHSCKGFYLDDIRRTSVIGWFDCAEYLEVIGNIYDDPELLGGEDDA